MTPLERASRRRRSLATVGLLTALAAFAAAPGSAVARPVGWGATTRTDEGPASLLLKVENGRVRIASVQAVMACYDPRDGTESNVALSNAGPRAVTLVRNRFRFDFAATIQGGREGRIKLSGTLGSNGRGTARLDATAIGRDDESNAIIERCQEVVSFALRRGR